MPYCSESNVLIAPSFVLSHCSLGNHEIGDARPGNKAMTTITANTPARRPAASRPLWSAWSLLQMPLLWLLRSCWRSELAALDIDQMRDCGLDPGTVRREAAKPFWRE
jgi:uncharacterized protein YjiS (DUF1127 family)